MLIAELEVALRNIDAQGLVKVGLHVADARELHERLTRLGVDADEHVGVDEHLRALAFVIRDPDGNRIRIFQDLSDSNN